MNPNFTNSNPINPTMAVNDDKTRSLKQFNTFNMDYDHIVTARYGDETPFYVFDGWSKDTVPLGSRHEMYTEPLQSRLASSVNMHKSYFSVPYKAIYPNTWDKFIQNPTVGDDVPTNQNSVFSTVDIITKFKAIFSTIRSVSVSNVEDSYCLFNCLLRYFLLFEAYFSRGGLLSYLGCKLTKYVNLNFTQTYSVDHLIDNMFANFSDLSQNATYTLKYNYSNGLFDNEVYYNPSVDYTTDKSGHVSLHRFLELMRDQTDFYVECDNEDTLVRFCEILVSFLGGISFTGLGVTDNFYINHSRLIAYQLIAHHFVSNDNVDDVYSADTWRDKINNILYSDLIFGSSLHSVPLFFNYNGTSVFYDHYSSAVLGYSFSTLSDVNLSSIEETSSVYSFFRLAYMHIYELHRWCKSLKFGDYFNGARSAPYAIGDLSAPVVGDGVSAIDMTRKIQLQRFANAVIKIGRRPKDYFQGIFGTALTPVITDPKFIARDTITLGVQDVENTADNQGSVVSLLRSDNSKFAFEVDVTDPCIIIGTLSFSVKRPYCNTIERFFFHKNRFDFFNPFMQYTGDQQIYAAEKLAGNISDSYAYQMRYAEYKQRYGQVSGGVVDYLKSWFFIADDNRDGEDEEGHISSNNIRSSNAEFDRFFASLSNYSLAGYFHFVFKFNNISSVVRNMDATPTIL